MAPNERLTAEQSPDEFAPWNARLHVQFGGYFELMRNYMLKSRWRRE